MQAYFLKLNDLKLGTQLNPIHYSKLELILQFKITIRYTYLKYSLQLKYMQI